MGIRLLQDSLNDTLLLHAQMLYQTSIVLGLLCLELCEGVSHDTCKMKGNGILTHQRGLEDRVGVELIERGLKKNAILAELVITIVEIGAGELLRLSKVNVSKIADLESSIPILK